MSGILVHRQRDWGSDRWFICLKPQKDLMAELGLNPQAPPLTTNFWAFSASSAWFPTCCLIVSLQDSWAENGLSTEAQPRVTKLPSRGQEGELLMEPGQSPGPCICCPHLAAKAAMPVPGTVWLLPWEFTRVKRGCGARISFRTESEVNGRKFSALVYQPGWAFLLPGPWDNGRDRAVFQLPCTTALASCLHSSGKCAPVPPLTLLSKN